MNPANFLHKQLAYFVGTPVDRRIHLFRPPSPASPMFLHERAQIILRRTEVLAWTFMVLVSLWIAVDMMIFPTDVAIPLIVGRVSAAIGLSILLVLSLSLVNRASWLTSYLTLLGLLAVPALFAVYAQPVFLHWQQHGGTFTPTQLAAISLYRQLPLIYIVGLALFPMTLFESIPLMAFVIGIMVLVDRSGSTSGVVRLDQWANLWVLLVAGGAAALAGVLQFNLLWQNHKLEDFESDTGLMKADAALEMLQLHWHDHGRKARPITLALINGKGSRTSSAPAAQHAPDESVTRLVDHLRRPLPQGIQAVRWSEHALGLVAVGPDSDAVKNLIGEISSQQLIGTGQPLEYAVIDRNSSGGVSPKNMLRMAEKRLRRQEAPVA